MLARMDKHNGLLIGLDGGTKMRFESLNLPHIFETIDVMPMRKAELRQGDK
ncbi:MAG: DUF4174 domain-containing protein [Pseudomonadota bacterium]